MERKVRNDFEIEPRMNTNAHDLKPVMTSSRASVRMGGDCKLNQALVRVERATRLCRPATRRAEWE